MAYNVNTITSSELDSLITSQKETVVSLRQQADAKLTAINDAQHNYDLFVDARIEHQNSLSTWQNEVIKLQGQLSADPTNESLQNSLADAQANVATWDNAVKTDIKESNRYLSNVYQYTKERQDLLKQTTTAEQTLDKMIADLETVKTREATTDKTAADKEAGNVPANAVPSGEESPVNEGAANKTDTDQTDPSKVPEAIPGDGATPTAGEKAAADAKASSKPSGSAKDAQDKAAPQAPAKAQWRDATDMRVTLRVPESYLVGPCAVLKDIGGILFPYTPEVSYESKATYGSQQPLHSNFAQYFYQRSSVGPITVTGKFSNQNQKDGVIYLGILHLLRALIKMPWGSDANAGSPPPICRFDAFGDSMLNNVPVVVDNFKAEMPSTVDYISVSSPLLGNTMVPTITQISMSLNIVYSRQEMQNYSVEKWLNSGLKGSGLGGRGYL